MYDRYHSISRTKTDAKWTKWPINKHRVSLKNEKLNKLLIWVHAFFLQYFYKHCRTDIDKNSSKCLAAIWGWTFAVWKWFILHSHYYPKIIGHILKITKWTVCLFSWGYMELKMKNRSHIYNINRSKSRHKHNYSKYKKCLRMTMLICIKQHLSNI